MSLFLKKAFIAKVPILKTLTVSAIPVGSWYSRTGGPKRVIACSNVAASTLTMLNAKKKTNYRKRASEAVQSGTFVETMEKCQR
jgi:hypothetical protein